MTHISVSGWQVAFFCMLIRDPGTFHFVLNHPLRPQSPLFPPVETEREPGEAPLASKKTSAEKWHTSLPLTSLWGELVIMDPFRCTCSWDKEFLATLAPLNDSNTLWSGRMSFWWTNSYLSHHSSGLTKVKPCTQEHATHKWCNCPFNLRSGHLLPLPCSHLCQFSKHWSQKVTFPDLPQDSEELPYQNPIVPMSRGSFVLFLEGNAS